MRDFSRMLAGARVGARNRRAVLRDLEPIKDVERRLDILGAAWSPEFEAACDRASLALFGVTERDTRPVEPHPDQVADPNGTAFCFSDAGWSSYAAALGAWMDWQEVMRRHEQEAAVKGARSYWAARGVDVDAADGQPLRSLPRFSRQLYAALGGLLPGAVFTPSGGGKRAAQSVEDWAAALAVEAARFRTSR